MDDPSLQIPLTPVGTWRGELIKITYRDTDRDGAPLVDKNGDAYAQVRLIVRPEAPQEDVDRKEAKAYVEAGGPEETVLSMMNFVRGKRDVSRLNTLLKSLGVPTSGRSIEAVAETFKGGIPCLFEVEHREYQGNTSEDVAAIYPAE
jgi:hypothetical protein